MIPASRENYIRIVLVVLDAVDPIRVAWVAVASSLHGREERLRRLVIDFHSSLFPRYYELHAIGVVVHAVEVILRVHADHVQTLPRGDMPVLNGGVGACGDQDVLRSQTARLWPPPHQLDPAYRMQVIGIF